MTHSLMPPHGLGHLKTPSEAAYEALKGEVLDFQRHLPENFEVGISVSGTENVIHVRSMHCRGQVIVFDGVDGQGRVARIIQHFTQVNVQMIGVEALADDAKRIGF